MLAYHEEATKLAEALGPRHVSYGTPRSSRQGGRATTPIAASYAAGDAPALTARPSHGPDASPRRASKAETEAYMAMTREASHGATHAATTRHGSQRTRRSAHYR